MTTTVATVTEAEYLSIEEAIAATPKGRAFLRRRDRVGRVVGADAVGQMVRGLKDWIAGADGPDRESLFMIRSELTAVRGYIDQAKSEISDLVADQSKSGNSHIQGATAELDEIVSATAAATNDILSAAEAINEVIAALPAELAGARDSLGQRCMDIFQACSFQDITGQRIAKVVKTLSYVEERVNAMIAIGDPHRNTPAAPVRTKIADMVAGDQPTDDAALLNGPQLPGLGLDQDAIDALLVNPCATVPAPARKAAAVAAPAAAPAPVPAEKTEALGQSAIDALFG